MPASKTRLLQQRLSALTQLSSSFMRLSNNLNARIRVSAPETPASSERLGELSLTVQMPPPRVAPPGHESYVSLASVKEDPNQVVLNCEDEYSQERAANLEAATCSKVSVSDDITVLDPTEEVLNLLSKDANLYSFINKCLRMSVKNTKLASRETRLRGLRSLRTERRVIRACAGNNMESDDEDEDLDDADDADDN